MDQAPLESVPSLMLRDARPKKITLTLGREKFAQDSVKLRGEVRCNLEFNELDVWFYEDWVQRLPGFVSTGHFVSDGSE